MVQQKVPLTAMFCDVLDALQLPVTSDQLFITKTLPYAEMQWIN
jgi:hypothetical protein